MPLVTATVMENVQEAIQCSECQQIRVARCMRKHPTPCRGKRRLATSAPSHTELKSNFLNTDIEYKNHCMVEKIAIG